MSFVRKLLIWSIVILGRYAVLPFAAIIIFLAGFIANWTLENPNVFSLALFAVFLTAALASMALTIGILFAGSGKRFKGSLSRQDAPGLWQVWDSLEQSRARRNLVVDEDLNASIGERKRFGGLFGRDVTMTVGLPFLLVLDERAITAIVAHEVAHARLMHTSGTVNLVEFQNAFDTLFDYADPDSTITGAVANLALGWLWTFLNSELMTRSRKYEIEADELACRWTSHDSVARALTLVRGCSALLEAKVYEPFETELLGAVAAPKSPIKRIVEARDTLLQREEIARYAAEAFEAQVEPDSTHPTLKQRLANIGVDVLPNVGVEATAASLLSPPKLEALISEIDSRTRRYSEAKIEGVTLVHY